MKSIWPTKLIGDTCTVMTGGTPSKSRPEFFGGEIRWLVSGDIHRGEIHDCEGRITEAGMNSSNAKILPFNSVMMALNGQGKTRGTVAILRTQATCNQSLVAISPNNPRELLPEFLYINLHGRYDELRRMTGDSGNDRRGLNMGLVRRIRIPLPPLPEQQRIVGILDEAFAGIATAKANAEKNLRNACELFESHVQSVFTQTGDGWRETTIGDQMTFQRGFDITKKHQKPGNVPVVSSGGVKSFHDTAMAKAPGVVIGRKGTLGKVFYIPSDYWPHDTTLWIKDFKGNDARFVYHFLRELDVAHLDSGSANPALNRNVLHPIRINWPQAELQRSIVAVFDRVEAESERLESVYEQKLAALDALKKSLLHQAFTGKL